VARNTWSENLNSFLYVHQGAGEILITPGFELPGSNRTITRQLV